MEERSGNRPGPPQKCHQDLTVLWCGLCAAAEAMTPCTRGVSDLGCGRGHDRRRGQIPWSLTPRDHLWRPHGQWRNQVGGTGRRPTTTAVTCPRTCNCRLRLAARESRSLTRKSPQRRAIQGNTSREAPFPLAFPLDRRLIATTMVAVVQVNGRGPEGAHGSRGGPSGADRWPVDRRVRLRSTRDLQPSDWLSVPLQNSIDLVHAPQVLRRRVLEPSDSSRLSPIEAL